MNKSKVSPRVAVGKVALARRMLAVAPAESSDASRPTTRIPARERGSLPPVLQGKSLGQLLAEHRANTHHVVLIDHSKGYRDLVFVGATSLEALLADERVVAYRGSRRQVTDEKGAVVCYVGGES